METYRARECNLPDTKQGRVRLIPRGQTSKKVALIVQHHRDGIGYYFGRLILEYVSYIL